MTSITEGSSGCREEDWKWVVSPKQMYVCVLLPLTSDDIKCCVVIKA